ncbi:MAG: histidine kinase [Bacteroidia bacterium]|nr:histidine kinase [Bacteroidia bacterium]
MKPPSLVIWGLGIVWFGIWHSSRAWPPKLWDGYQWKRLDSCKWEVHRTLPRFSESLLRPGDQLLRIDYLPVCDLTHIPPGKEKGRLYLYEISREGRIQLVFVESQLPLVFGWPSSPKEYTLTRLLSFLVWLFALFLMGVTADQWRWEWPSLWREGLSLLVSLLPLGVFWFFWEEPTPIFRSYFTPFLLSLWGIWSISRVTDHRLQILLAILSMGCFFTDGIPFLEGIGASALLGSSLLTLSGPTRLIYTLVWMGWGTFPHPLAIPLLGGIILTSHIPLLKRTFGLLPKEKIAFRSIAILAGIGMGILYRSEGFLLSFLWGMVSLGIGIALTEVLWRVIQARQRRVRLLQERLPQLWEIVDKNTLRLFIEETLREYADIGEIEISTQGRPSGETRPWLRRSGESPPFEITQLRFSPDALIPLPAYGWLALREGTRQLGPEDVRRLMPFAAGISIALRHLSLFEAAHEARLAALRGQLSPHFLFNALNTLQALIAENPSLAEELMTRLGALLRRSLLHARHVTVPLEEELALVRDYLSIEKERFGQRLRLSWNLPESLPSLEIPPFAIQLLAENTIKHAVSRVNRPVTVEISVVEKPTEVEIIVQDDGPGIDLNRIKESVGLSNLLLRLEQLYPEKATLLPERLTKGTRVTLRFLRPLPETTARSHNPAIDLS